MNGKTTYSQLPTHEPASHQDLPSFTVKSTGAARFCKKCQARKPDRAHHCSTCRRCVLKMDHHCPWLATCVGLKNYKSFLLFLIYTTIFCWLCFGVTGSWLWKEIMNNGQLDETFMPINYVLLCTISGIIGLVLTGFTAWHFSLAWRNQTTIECLEKTRYLSPLRKSMRRHQNGVQGQSYGRQLAEIHANAVPGATRDEEGEEMLSTTDTGRSPAIEALRTNYNEMERSRERERYEEYLDEQDSEKLPNAFDLGWKTNLRHLFGEKSLLWFIPICNTLGDGWQWEPSQKWIKAREDLKRQREVQRNQEHQYGERYDSQYLPGTISQEDGSRDGYPTTSRYGKHLPNGSSLANGSPDTYFHDHLDNDSASSKMSLKTLRRRESFDNNVESDDHDDYDVSSDEEETQHAHQKESMKNDYRKEGTPWSKRD
ncbi:MAG: hypothetical protein Q9222_003025 [Ikaeria aurantiellina]